MTLHPREDALLAYLDEDAAFGDLSATRAHVASCDECARTIENLRAWSNIFTDPAVWESADDPDKAEVDALARRGRRITAEDQEAAQFIADLPSDKIAAWADAVEVHQERRTAGLVRRLIAETRARHDSAPADGIAILALAEGVLHELAEPDPRLEGDIGKERGNAYRKRGEYVDALAALDAAERAYRARPACAYDCALVDWARASVFFKMKRFGEARSQIARATEVFARHEDDVALAQLRILEGSILFEEGDDRAARDTFQAAAPLLEDIGDEESLARVFANMAGCEIRLADFMAAREHATLAQSMYERLGMDSEAVRLAWSLGDALKLMGRPEEALEALRYAAARFDVLGMAGDVAAVGLDAAELLNERGEFAEAAAIAARLVTYFRSQEADVDAAQALFDLQQAIEGMRATSVIFAAVRAHVSSGLRDR